MQKKLLFISIMLIVLCSLSAVSASEINGTDEVAVDSDSDLLSVSSDVVSTSEINGTDEVDSGDLLSAPSTSTVTVSTWSNLKSACTNATQYDTIYVSGGITPPSTKGQISISKSVTIEGLSGSYIGGSSSNNVVTYSYIPIVSSTSGLTITLKNLNFQNMGDDKVLMKFSGNGNYVLENCTFTNVNATGDHQSVVWLNYGTGYINNCTFANCTTSYGAVTNYYSSWAPLVNNAKLNVQDSVFKDNYATVEPGAINNCGLLTVSNTVFEDNYATWWAGAIHTHSYANTTIVGSRFKNNIAGWNGGALYAYSILNVYNSTFEGNNCTTNNGGGAIGASNYGSTYNVTINNCTFTNNHNINSAGYGGAISAMDAGYFHLYYSTFINNTAVTGKAIAVREGEYIDNNHTWDENVTLGNPVFGIAYNTFIDIEAHTNDANIAYVSNNASYIAAHNNVFYTPSEYANLGNNQQSNSIFTDELLGLSLDDVEIIGDSQDTPQWSMDGFDSSNSMESPYDGIANGAIVWNYTGNTISSLSIDKDGRIIVVNNGHLLYLYGNGTVYSEALISSEGSTVRFFSIKNFSISPNNYFTIITEDTNGYILHFAETDKSVSISGPTTYLIFTKYDAETLSINNIPLFADKNDEKVHILLDDGDMTLYNFNEIIREPSEMPYEGYTTISSYQSSPIVTGSEIWVPTTEGIEIFSLNAFVDEAEVSPIKTISASVSSRPVADADGNVYFFTSDSISKADSTNGVTKTQAVTGGIGSRMAISSVNNALYSVNSLGTLYKYSLADLTESEVYDIGTPASTIMTDANGVIYVGTTDGKFYAVSDAGDEIWSVDTESESEIKNCAMDNEGNIYFYTAENKVYAINEKPLDDANLTFEVKNKYTVLDDITFTTNINSAVDGQNIAFTVMGVDVEYTNEYNATIADGQATWNIGNLDIGNYKVEATYAGDSTFASDSIVNEFTVSDVGPQWSMDGFDSSNSHESPYKGVSDGAIVWNYTLTNSINGFVIDKDGRIIVTNENENIIYYLNDDGTENKTITTLFPQLGVNQKIYPKNISISLDNKFYIPCYVAFGNFNDDEKRRIITFSTDYESNTYEQEYYGDFFPYGVLYLDIGYLEVEGVDCPIYYYTADTYGGIEIKHSSGVYYSEGYVCTDSVVVSGTKMWVPSNDGLKLHDINNKDDSSLILLKTITGVIGRPVADADGNVYFFTSDSISKADATNGVTKTQAVTGGTGSRMAISSVNNALYSVNSLGILYKYSLADLTESEVYDIGTPASTIMTDANGVIYVGTTDGKFYAISDAGDEIWSVDTESESEIKNCAMDNEGNIYFYTAENKVYAINEAPLPDANLTFEVDEKFNTTDDIAFTANINSTLDGQNITFTVMGVDVDYKDSYNATIADGVATWAIGKLGAGNYTVDAAYVSDGTFADANITCNFEVAKVTPELSVNVNNATVFENATITVTSTNCEGNVTVKVGDEYTFENVTIGEELILPLLPADVYDVSVTYTEDSTYAKAVNDTEKLEISKVTPELSVNINNGTIFTNASITVTSSNCEGKVTVKVGDDYSYENVVIGEEFILPLLSVGVYDVEVSYAEDANYTDAVNDTEQLEITKEKTLIEPAVDGSTVTLLFDGKESGIVFLDVEEVGYYADIEDGVAVFDIQDLEPGKYTGLVKYPGDENYADAEMEINIEIPELSDPELDVTVNGTEVTVSLDELAAGYVVVTVGNDSLFFEYEGSPIVVDFSNLEPGNYTVDVFYSGDDVFASDSASAEIEVPEIEPLDPELEVAVNDTVVTVSLNELAAGYVVVTVGNDSLFFEYEGGPIVVDLSDLEPGNYTVDVAYSGDEFFDSAEDSVEVSIPEVEPLDPELDVAVDGTVVTVSLNENATGYVVVGIVDDMNQFFEYDGEPIDVDFDGLQPGDYTVEVFYSGDEYFAQANATVIVTIPEVEPEDPELKAFAEGSDVIITLNEDATGMVLVGLDDVVLFFPALGEPIIVDLSFLTPGNYTVAIKYLGDEVFAPANATVTVTIPEDEKKDAGLKASVSGTELTVSLNKKATGYVLAGVEGGLLFYEYEGKDIVVDLSYLEAGNYTIIVLYSGDEAFYPGETSANVTIPEEPVVEPKDPNLKATAANNTITATVDKDATGNVLVDVDGQGYYATIKDGKAIVNVIGLDEGKYQATVTYAGDDVYKAANATVSITVPKKEDPTPEPVDPKADIKIDNGTVSAELPKDATGYMLVDVDGTGYYAPVKDGKASLDLPELAPGNHTVTVTYTGDKKYDSANATKTIEVEAPVETIISENLT
ncbi:MAG: Ig-like domain repeat protein, partial [Methanobrevibacter sp.]|nr:Ig-like domain repeat protein [Methanobrevibacter sp.]